MREHRLGLLACTMVVTPITSRCGSESDTSTRRRSVSARLRRPRLSGSLLRLRPILPLVIGIVGGTFDPPHIGHLAVAAAAVEQLAMETVTFLPAGDPWQKAETDVTPGRHRLAMTRLAGSEAHNFVVDDREMIRPGPSYMMDTVESMEDDVVLILGADAARGIHSWHRSAELLDSVTIAVAARPGVDMADVEAAVGSGLVQLSMPTIDLSGTEIRQHIAAGRSPRFLVPDSVCDYIDAHALYKGIG
jgi:nicotinate-nucleotide adenylyltransferase